MHSGQVCSAGTRVLVEKSIHDRVVTEIVRRARAIYVGGPDDPRTETGPLISKDHLAKVETYMQDAVKDGATILVGGSRIDREDLNKGWYFPPTVIDNCFIYCLLGDAGELGDERGYYFVRVTIGLKFGEGSLLF